MVFEDLEPLIGYHFLRCWPCVFGLILRQGNSSSNGWFIPSFPFCRKTVIQNTLRGIARSSTSCIYAGKDNFFTIPMVFALEDSLQKTIVLRWNEYSFCFYTGPNQVRIMDQMPNRLSVRVQVSVVKTGTYEGIGQRLIGFCV